MALGSSICLISLNVFDLPVIGEQVGAVVNFFRWDP